MFYTLKTPPASEPVTLTEAKTRLRVDGSESDTDLESLITSARQYVESVTRRSLMTQTWEARAAEFSDEIRLSHLPLQSVDSITYTDADGAEQTLSADVYDVDTVEGVIRRAHGESWPCAREHSIAIEFTAGYSDSSDVPQPIKDAMLLHIQLLYDRPDPNYARALERARDDLLTPYRVLIL